MGGTLGSVDHIFILIHELEQARIVACIDLGNDLIHQRTRGKPHLDRFTILIFRDPRLRKRILPSLVVAIVLLHRIDLLIDSALLDHDFVLFGSLANELLLNVIVDDLVTDGSRILGAFLEPVCPGFIFSKVGAGSKVLDILRDRVFFDGRTVDRCRRSSRETIFRIAAGKRDAADNGKQES